jgi:hypothetical protein
MKIPNRISATTNAAAGTAAALIAARIEPPIPTWTSGIGGAFPGATVATSRLSMLTPTPILPPLTLFRNWAPRRSHYSERRLEGGRQAGPMA